MPATRRSQNVNIHPGLPDKPKARRSAAEVAIQKKEKEEKKALAAAAKQRKLDHLAVVETGMAKAVSKGSSSVAIPQAPVKAARGARGATKTKISGARQSKKALGKRRADASPSREAEEFNMSDVEPESQPEELVCKFDIRAIMLANQCLGSQFLPADSPLTEPGEAEGNEGEDPRILDDSEIRIEQGGVAEDSDEESSIDLSWMPPAIARKQLVLATASDIRKKRKTPPEETQKKYNFTHFGNCEDADLITSLSGQRGPKSRPLQLHQMFQRFLGSRKALCPTGELN